MEEFHILQETPANSGTYTETGEIITTNVEDAKARCVELAQDGTRYGMWVYESVNALNLAKPGDAPPVAGPPVNVDVPHVTQTGSTLNCTMGNWTGEPTSYSYQWQLDGTNTGAIDQDSYAVQPADVGKSAACLLTAINAQGSAVAPVSNAVVVT